MAEEVQQEQVQQNTQTEKKEPEYTPIQLKAIDQGWVPQDQFEGDPEDFIDAPEFVRRGELFGKIEEQSREIKRTRQALEAFKQHHSKVKEAEFNRALKTLKEQRKQALIDGETATALSLEDEIDNLASEAKIVKEELASTEVENQEQEFTPEFQAWVKRNSWYVNDHALQGAADAIARKLIARGVSKEALLDQVSEQIKKEFPNKFASRKPQATPVESSTRSRPTSSSTTYRMNEDERAIMRKIVATGVMTEEQYIKDLIEINKSKE